LNIGLLVKILALKLLTVPKLLKPKEKVSICLLNSSKKSKG
jgi:hypothetical protein